MRLRSSSASANGWSGRRHDKTTINGLLNWLTSNAVITSEQRADAVADPPAHQRMAGGVRARAPRRLKLGPGGRDGKQWGSAPRSVIATQYIKGSRIGPVHI